MTRPLRFAMVTTFYPPYSFGGDAIAIRRHARALVRRGHEVTVIHDVDTYVAMSDGHVAPDPKGESDGIRVHGLESRLGVISPVSPSSSRSAESGGTAQLQPVSMQGEPGRRR